MLFMGESFYFDIDFKVKTKKHRITRGVILSHMQVLGMRAVLRFHVTAKSAVFLISIPSSSIAAVGKPGFVHH